VTARVRMKSDGTPSPMRPSAAMTSRRQGDGESGARRSVAEARRRASAFARRPSSTERYSAGRGRRGEPLATSPAKP